MASEVFHMMEAGGSERTRKRESELGFELRYPELLWPPEPFPGLFVSRLPTLLVLSRSQ